MILCMRALWRYCRSYNSIMHIYSFLVYRLISKFYFFHFIRLNLVVPHHLYRFQCALNHCMQVLRESWPMHVLYICMHVLQLIHWKHKFLRKTKALIGCSCKLQKVFHHSPSTLVGEIFEFSPIRMVVMGSIIYIY